MTRRDADATECDWLAFLYISDEMSADERERFEERLECDLAAQSALAEMVGLTTGILAARQSARPQFRTRPTIRRQDQRVVILIACACLALLAAIFPATNPPAVGPESLSQSPGDDTADQRVDELVNLWSAGGAVDASWELTDPATLENDANDVLLSDELNVPVWLLAAVSAGEAGQLPEIE